MAGVIQPFNAQAETYRVNYVYVHPDEFERKLVEALASGVGPDLILAPYQIILSQSDRIYPFPIDNLSQTTYNTNYIDGAGILWTPQGALALPVAAEPMVLFFNRTLLSKHGVTAPPVYWGDLIRIVPALTVTDAQGNFSESGIAIGTHTVTYMKDIVMAIVHQFGQVPVLTEYTQDGTAYRSILANVPVNEASRIQPLSSIMRFLTEFADPTKSTYSWNQFAGDPQDAFVAEKLAMYIGYAGELPTIKNRNPRMNVDMTYLPQMLDYKTFSTDLRLYGIATMKQTKNPTVALTTEANLGNTVWAPQLATIVGAVPPFRSYLSTAGLDEITQKSLLVARGWYDIDAIQTSTYMSQMFQEIVSGRKGVNDAADDFVSRMYDLYTDN
jgi:ABC-type glycerol-3-phosphate transport system substrate-binding protein